MAFKYLRHPSIKYRMKHKETSDVSTPLDILLEFSVQLTTQVYSIA